MMNIGPGGLCVCVPHLVFVDTSHQYFRILVIYTFVTNKYIMPQEYLLKNIYQLLNEFLKASPGPGLESNCQSILSYLNTVAPVCIISSKLRAGINTLAPPL